MINNIRIEAVYNRKGLKENSPYAIWVELMASNPLVPIPSIAVIKRKRHSISGFLDKKISDALEKKIDFELTNETDTFYSVSSTNDEVLLVSLRLSADDFLKFSNAEFIQFFLKICNALPPDHLRCHDTLQLHNLLRKEYVPRRTFLTPGLMWLNFFGKEEEIIQGGKALENNPFATCIERFENGLFIQVNETIMDCLKPEGLERLVNATKAMPPVVPQTSSLEVEIVDAEDNDEDIIEDDEDEKDS